MDMMVDDASSSAISDKIKEILYTKSAEKIDAARLPVGAELLVTKFQKFKMNRQMKLK